MSLLTTRSNNVKSNTSTTVRQVLMGALIAASVSTAYAEEAAPEYTFLDAIKAGKNMTSFRLRYEKVEQDGLQPLTTVGTTLNPTRFQNLKDAEGITLRS